MCSQLGSYSQLDCCNSKGGMDPEAVHDVWTEWALEAHRLEILDLPSVHRWDAFLLFSLLISLWESAIMSHRLNAKSGRTYTKATGERPMDSDVH